MKTEHKATYTEGVGWRQETDTRRHHRESLWDYKGRAIYHVTLATEERQPIFGTLVGDSAEDARIAFTRLGAYVNATFRGLPAFFAPKGIRIRVLAVRVMPDHLHGVIHVLEPMPKSIGEVVRSFKSACTSWFKREVFARGALAKMPEECITANQIKVAGACAAFGGPAAEGGSSFGGAAARAGATLGGLTAGGGSSFGGAAAGAGAALGGSVAGGGSSGGGPVAEEAVLVQFCRIFATRGSIWEYMPAGYHERILHCDGQLDRMIHYVKDNPRRLWLRRHNAGLFRLHNDLARTFVDHEGVSHTWRFRAMGNMFLLDFPLKQHIQCSRSITEASLASSLAQWQCVARQGVVSVTSAISEGEKTAARRLREEGLPLIVMLKDGFPPEGSPHERYFKPGGVYFDACASGKLLLIEPYAEVLDDPTVSAAVCRKSPMAVRASLRYHFLALNVVGTMLTTSL